MESEPVAQELFEGVPPRLDCRMLLLETISITLTCGLVYCIITGIFRLFHKYTSIPQHHEHIAKNPGHKARTKRTCVLGCLRLRLECLLGGVINVSSSGTSISLQCEHLHI